MPQCTSPDPEKSSCIGAVAHIYSAAEGGPRGRGGLSEEELKSPANAIWLCENHASLIDKNAGADYSSGSLLSYKSLHETRIAQDLSSINKTFGWFKDFRIYSSPLLSDYTKIEFGKLTLLVGDNGSGKTALCEWLASATHIDYLERWEHSFCGQHCINIEVNYLNPEPRSIKIAFQNHKSPKFFLDGRFMPISPASINIVFPKLNLLYSNKSNDDLDLLASILNLHPYEIFSICDEISHRGTDNVTGAWFIKEDDKYFLCADVKCTYSGLTFRMLSFSEQVRVIIEFAILAASDMAQTNPTILILDSGKLDIHWMSYFGETLNSPEFNFQTLAAMSTPDYDLNNLRDRLRKGIPSGALS